MGKALDIIKQLNIKEFEWKHNDLHDIGLIAEEVAQVLPEAVFYNNEGQIEGLKLLTLISVILEALKELQEGK